MSAIGRARLLGSDAFESEIGRVVVSPEDKPSFEIGFLRREISDGVLTLVLEPGSYRLSVEDYSPDRGSG